MADEHWYRTEVRMVCCADPWEEDIYYSRPELYTTKYKVLSTTPKGVWVQGFMQPKTFVLGTAMKQFAVPTVELAAKDCIARKKVQISINEARIRGMKSELSHTEEHLRRLESQ